MLKRPVAILRSKIKNSETVRFLSKQSLPQDSEAKESVTIDRE